MNWELTVAAGLWAGAAGTAGYWWNRRRRAGARLAAADASGARLALELLGAHRLPSDPKLLEETLRHGVDRLLARSPSLSAAVWRRDKAGAVLVHRSGALSAAAPEACAVPEREWSAAFDVPQGLEWRGGVSALNPGLARAGVGSARAAAWGRPDGLGGLLLLCDPDPNGGGLLGAAADLDLVTAYFGGAARLAESLWEMQRSRERLEGGLTTLHAVASTIISNTGRPSDSLGAVVSIVAKAMNADLCAFLLHDEKTGELVTQPGAYGLSGDEGSLYRLPLDNETASSVRVFRSGKPFVTGDAQNDPLVISHYAKLWKCHSLMVVPLTLEGRRLGVLRVGSFQKDFFTLEHLQFAELIAEEAVVLLEGAVLTAKLEETNERLAEINRIKDEFVSTVSHEFKTPLTSIKGFATVMLEETSGALNTEQKRFLTIIQSACDRLNSLVSDLLDIARLEGGVRMEFAPVSLSEAALHCREVHSWQAESRKVDLRIEVPAGLPLVRGDERWLRQVLDNLVSNALKFTPAGGTVRVAAAVTGTGIEVSVSDTGMGIPAEDQPRIFEKFYRARNKANVPGTGLGLAIARTVIEKHGGRLWFESELGEGSTFHFQVPVAQAAEAVETS